MVFKLTGLLCTRTYLLSSVNIRKADKLCLMNLSSSACYSQLLIACVTTVYTKPSFNSSPRETKYEHVYLMNKHNVKEFCKTISVYSVKSLRVIKEDLSKKL